MRGGWSRSDEYVLPGWTSDSAFAAEDIWTVSRGHSTPTCRSVYADTYICGARPTMRCRSRPVIPLVARTNQPQSAHSRDASYRD